MFLLFYEKSNPKLINVRTSFTLKSVHFPRWRQILNVVCNRAWQNVNSVMITVAYYCWYLDGAYYYFICILLQYFIVIDYKHLSHYYFCCCRQMRIQYNVANCNLNNEIIIFNSAKLLVRFRFVKVKTKYVN